jgi:hypothetical protein
MNILLQSRRAKAHLAEFKRPAHIRTMGCELSQRTAVCSRDFAQPSRRDRDLSIKKQAKPETY